MTKEEASNLKSFSQYCNCGGYSRKISKDTHMQWCCQYPEYMKWYNALYENIEENKSNE